eukprot:TRINITY_DN5875_c0_g1_i1.p1 TRINITY_DN5875_c0_g1~~TRINITY_DN5875_c0_g1_i1.p1  ORF type:complete len:151 (-),score=44.27 TRINITY_DN5875_c0_g1_i1:4-456(-)
MDEDYEPDNESQSEEDVSFRNEDNNNNNKNIILNHQNNLINNNDYVPPYIMRRKTIDIQQRKRKNGSNDDPSKAKFYKVTPGKFCYYCGTTTSTEWRRGPDRTNSLCNACGLRFTKNKKREKSIPPKPPSRIPITDILNKHDKEVKIKHK